MIIKLYSIRDTKVGNFNPPVRMDNDAAAVRSFGDLVTATDKPTLFSQHPADFALCYIGDFDVEKGVLIPAEGGFRSLAMGSDFIKE